MGLRDITREALKNLRKKITGEVDIQELLNRNQVKMEKTREYEADDHQDKMPWSYRFTFANQARKQDFLKAIGKYPPQEWDDFVNWFDDISNLNGELCVEARCLVPPDETSKFRYKFEHFITRDIIVKG